MFKIVHPCDEVFHLGTPRDPLLACRNGEGLLAISPQLVHRSLLWTLSRPAASWIQIDSDAPEIRKWSEREGLILKGNSGLPRLTEAGQSRLRRFPWDPQPGEGLALLHAINCILPELPEVVGIWRPMAHGSDPQALVPLDRLALFEQYGLQDQPVAKAHGLQRANFVLAEVGVETRERGYGDVGMKLAYIDGQISTLLRLDEDEEGRALCIVAAPPAGFLSETSDSEITRSSLRVGRESFDGTMLFRQLDPQEAKRLLRYFSVDLPASALDQGA